MLIKNKLPEKIFRRKSVNMEFSGSDCGARQISYFPSETWRKVQDCDNNIPRNTHWGDVADVKQ